jgi:MATE family multidrug resistance protein
VSQEVDIMSPDRARRPSGRSLSLELLVLALPIIAMTVSRMLMTFVDFVMVSALGTEAQAAISPASLFVFAVGCLGLGIAHGVQTFVSQADGRDEPEEAGPYAWQSLYIAGFFGLLTVPAVATTELWFGKLAALGSHSAQVTQLEIDYVRIALWAVAPSIICIGMNGFFMGIQKPWVGFFAIIASLAANVFGNWVLIFGHLGFPALGIAGAAYATVGAWWVRATVLLAAMFLPAFARRYNTRRSLRFSWHKLLNLIHVGAPTSVGWLVDIGSWMVFLMLIMPAFGTEAMAASNVGLQLMHLSFMPAVGIGIAVCSQVGYAIGAGRPDEAGLRTRVAFRLTGAYMGLVGLLFLLAREPLVRIFNHDPAVVSIGSFVLIWAAVFQVFDAMAITHMNALRGAGDTRWPAVAMGLACWTVFVVGGYSAAHLAPQWGINGPWAMCTIYIIIIGVALRWRWLGGKWREIRLFGGRRGFPVASEAPDEAPMTTGAPLDLPADEAAPAVPPAVARDSAGA